MILLSDRLSFQTEFPSLSLCSPGSSSSPMRLEPDTNHFSTQSTVPARNPGQSSVFSSRQCKRPSYLGRTRSTSHLCPPHRCCDGHQTRTSQFFVKRLRSLHLHASLSQSLCPTVSRSLTSSATEGGEARMETAGGKKKKKRRRGAEARVR